ncbi:cation transport protein-domain-containing protein [Trametes maxima]|nr:cation transport protein-domain-containing protein [Trametes maxima]
MAILDLLSDVYSRVRQWIQEEANFFRLHLLFFTFTPLVAAGIFYGVNGEFHIPFIDALFLCYSALTVTGLSTVNLSTLTVFQQVILFVLMAMGDITIIAWVMVLVRMHYFREHIIERHRKKTVLQSMRDRLGKLVSGVGHSIPLRHVEAGSEKHTQHGSNGIQASDGIGAALVGGATTGLGLGIALGTRENTANVLAQDEPREAVADDPNPESAAEKHSQHGSNGIQASDGIGAALVGGAVTGLGIGIALSSAHSTETNHTLVEPKERSDGSAQRSRAPSRINTDLALCESPTEQVASPIADVQFITSSPRSGAMPLRSPTSQRSARRAVQFPNLGDVGTNNMRQRRGVPVPRRRTIIVPPKVEPTVTGELPLGQRNKDQGLGGFPGPWALSKRLMQSYYPSLYRRLENMTVRERVQSNHAKWLKNDHFQALVIGRNGDFHTEELSDEELEELGGIEYRALRLLSYIVILYFLGTQMITFILIAPWLSTSSSYDDVFAAQPRMVNKSWFSAFQIVAAYTGGGMSLVDAGMVPFQKAYLMIFSLLFVILAGNHGLPIFLRFVIWLCSKFAKDKSLADEALDFLLDHPRRCFLYLFPSHVTWYLVATLVSFTIIELVCFIVLNIGLDVTEMLAPGTRVVAGLFQSFAVRASGFSIVSLSSLAPSFQFLCIIMMYIAIYPVALSIRSTNVYEEKSLGVFEVSPEDEDEEPNLDEEQPRRERIGKYFGWHLRRQLSFDIWWLVFGIFAICIIERTKIMDDANAPWFNVFRIVFELVSAFGGIGLTLGIPTQNFSFAGAFGPLSKIVVIIIMVRGRHRGLPVAIDRAILLPEDLKPNKPADQLVAPGAEAQVVDVSEKEKMTQI